MRGPAWLQAQLVERNKNAFLAWLTVWSVLQRPRHWHWEHRQCAARSWLHARGVAGSSHGTPSWVSAVPGFLLTQSECAVEIWKTCMVQANCFLGSSSFAKVYPPPLARSQSIRAPSYSSGYETVHVLQRRTWKSPELRWEFLQEWLRIGLGWQRTFFLC